MPNKNPHYKELKRYLTEVEVGRRKLELKGLVKRLEKAFQSGVSFLDICELFTQYAPTSPSCTTHEKDPYVQEYSDPEEREFMRQFDRSYGYRLLPKSQRTQPKIRTVKTPIL